jgi:hypothetical protein
MGTLKDLEGLKFGRWFVTDRSAVRGNAGQVFWSCRCDCGVMCDVQSLSLVNGSSQSCGCLRSEVITTHGMLGTSEYGAWQAAKSRCYNNNIENYSDYGGRGIQVCDRWLNSFENFYADMGPKPTPEHSIDRYPDNDGNYEPGNCRWATWDEQANNRRNNVLVTHDGKVETKSQLARENGISAQLLYQRMKNGKTITQSVQNTARSYDHSLFLHNGVERNISELSKISGVKEPTLYYRLITAKWPLEKALGKNR